jgi:hypothetical protein
VGVTVTLLLAVKVCTTTRRGLVGSLLVLVEVLARIVNTTVVLLIEYTA